MSKVENGDVRGYTSVLGDFIRYVVIDKHSCTNCAKCRLLPSNKLVFLEKASVEKDELIGRNFKWNCQ